MYKNSLQQAIEGQIKAREYLNSMLPTKEWID